MTLFDENSILLNPNCSEVVWRLKGISQTHKGTNQEAYRVFINQILRVYATLAWDQKQINRSIPIYIKGDGGVEMLATSFYYALDLINKIRDPREVELDELEDKFINGGYDPDISQTWVPLVTKPRNPAASPTDTEKILERIWRNFQPQKNPRKKRITTKKAPK